VFKKKTNKTAGFTAWLASASSVCGKTREPVKGQDSDYNRVRPEL